MTSRHRPLLVLSVFALALAMGIGGCGGDDNGDPVRKDKVAGSADDDGPSPLKFSRCMRDQGFSWYPDPDAGGNLSANEPQGLDRAKYQQAQKKCEVYAPWGGGSGNKKTSDELDKLRKVSQCMREHGFAKFPDPDENGSINIDKGMGISPDDPALQKAQQDCQKYAPEP
ncbi:hypothetical protein [Actinocorallia longicatena]